MADPYRRKFFLGKCVPTLKMEPPSLSAASALPQVPTSASYAHHHTRAWSEEIAAHDAFIFATPQYNWGYPASIKNAIDYLYTEWKGKPAMVVSYGGRGGGKAAVQLGQVLQGVRMRVAPTMPGLAFGSEENGEAAMKEGRLTEDAMRRWKEDGKEEDAILMAFGELLDLLGRPVALS